VTIYPCKRVLFGVVSFSVPRLLETAFYWQSSPPSETSKTSPKQTLNPVSLSLSLFLLNRLQFHPAHKSSPKKMISLTAGRSLPKHKKKQKKRKTKRRTSPIDSSRGFKTKTEVQKQKTVGYRGRGNKKEIQQRNHLIKQPNLVNRKSKLSFPPADDMMITDLS